jgi:hypothetical protein
MASIETEILDNLILSVDIPDGHYHIDIKEIRNPRLNGKYWKLLEFVINELPHNAEYVITWFGVELFKVPVPHKYALHSFFKTIYGVESTSFSEMDEQQFRDYYSKVLDICCKLLGNRDREVIEKLVGFM